MNEDNLVKMSPPWHTFHNFLKHSIGRDHCVDVLEMEEISDIRFLIQIEVKNRDKALALATILEPCKNFGNIDVYVEVLHCGKIVKPSCKHQDVCSVIETIEKALDTNYYFKKVEHVDFFGTPIIFPTFKKEVIQFFNDDLSDFYQNFNGVAAHVFREVLRFEVDGIHIRPSTARE